MSGEKKAELPPRVIVEFTTLGNEVVGFYLKKMELRGSWGMPEEYLSLSEHQSLLTAAEEKLRIAREAMRKEIDHGCECGGTYLHEALAKLGGADERS